jgi:hypothetical protein
VRRRYDRFDKTLPNAESAKLREDIKVSNSTNPFIVQIWINVQSADSD